MLALASLCLVAACGAAPVATQDAPVQPAPPSPSTSAAAPPPVRDGLPAILPPDSTHSGGWQHYGADFRLGTDARMGCEDLLADLPAHVGQTLRVGGRVAEVCQSEGCWMVLTPLNGGSQVIRVTMQDRSFSVDKQGAGRQADVEGVLVASDQTYQLIASAVRFRNQ